MAADKLRVYITIDTETSMGGAWWNGANGPVTLDKAIFGLCDSRAYGIPLIMDILGRYNFRATFFTEVFCSYAVGMDELGRVFRYITERGHDIQLHAHPVYRFYYEYLSGGPKREQDRMCVLPPDEQDELIEDAIRIFRALAGYSPRAYRAGSYAASEATLECLRQNGLVIDSSYNHAYIGSTCGFQTLGLNSPTVIKGVCELPVTVFRSGARGRFKPLEISAVSAREVVVAIGLLQALGYRDVVLILHSFSLLKNTGLRYETSRPDHLVIRRLEKVCAALRAMREEVEVRAIGEVDVNCIGPTIDIVPRLPLYYGIIRKSMQALNRVPWF